MTLPQSTRTTLAALAVALVCTECRGEGVVAERLDSAPRMGTLKTVSHSRYFDLWGQNGKLKAETSVHTLYQCSRNRVLTRSVAGPAEGKDWLGDMVVPDGVRTDSVNQGLIVDGITHMYQANRNGRDGKLVARYIQGQDASSSGEGPLAGLTMGDIGMLRCHSIANRAVAKGPWKAVSMAKMSWQLQQTIGPDARWKASLGNQEYNLVTHDGLPQWMTFGSGASAFDLASPPQETLKTTLLTRLKENGEQHVVVWHYERGTTTASNLRHDTERYADDAHTVTSTISAVLSLDTTEPDLTAATIDVPVDTPSYFQDKLNDGIGRIWNGKAIVERPASTTQEVEAEEEDVHKNWKIVDETEDDRTFYWLIGGVTIAGVAGVILAWRRRSMRASRR